MHVTLRNLQLIYLILFSPQSVMTDSRVLMYSWPRNVTRVIRTIGIFGLSTPHIWHRRHPNTMFAQYWTFYRAEQAGAASYISVEMFWWCSARMQNDAIAKEADSGMLCSLREFKNMLNLQGLPKTHFQTCHQLAEDWQFPSTWSIWWPGIDNWGQVWKCFFETWDTLYYKIFNEKKI